MKFLFIIFLILATGCMAQQKSDSWLYMISVDDDPGKAGYVNSNGDTIVPIGKYAYCFEDTIKYFGAVFDTTRRTFVAIDTEGKFMYEIFIFDNGPDYVKEGLFRIQENGKIGYANEKGEVVIAPTYEAAEPFEKGKARVALKARRETDGEEHWYWVADKWFYIDKKGNRLKE